MAGPQHPCGAQAGAQAGIAGGGGGGVQQFVC